MNWTILTQHPSHSLVGGIVFWKIQAAKVPKFKQANITFGYVQFQGSWHRASSQELHSKQSIGLPAEMKKRLVLVFPFCIILKTLLPS